MKMPRTGTTGRLRYWLGVRIFRLGLRIAGLLGKEARP